MYSSSALSSHHGARKKMHPIRWGQSSGLPFQRGRKKSNAPILSCQKYFCASFFLLLQRNDSNNRTLQQPFSVPFIHLKLRIAIALVDAPFCAPLLSPLFCPFPNSPILPLFPISLPSCRTRPNHRRSILTLSCPLWFLLLRCSLPALQDQSMTTLRWLWLKLKLWLWLKLQLRLRLRLWLPLLLLPKQQVLAPKMSICQAMVQQIIASLAPTMSKLKPVPSLVVTNLLPTLPYNMPRLLFLVPTTIVKFRNLLHLIKHRSIEKLALPLLSTNSHP
ncbi:hypothetical protein V8F33_012300 [Rhypophila sp. PSN 637]